MPYTQLFQPYVLPAASTSTLGGIKTDGTITTLNANNQIQISKNDLLAGTGTESLAIGDSSMASGDYSVAIGSHARATSHVVNDHVESSGIAIGDTAKATDGGIQLGSGTNADHDAFCVGGASNYKLLDLSTGLIPSARIPGATVANAGKYLTINSSGEIVAADLPLYNGGVN